MLRTSQGGSGGVSAGKIPDEVSVVRYENAATLVQVIYTKHNFDQELLFRPVFASFPTPNGSRIHSNASEQCDVVALGS